MTVDINATLSQIKDEVLANLKTIGANVEASAQEVELYLESLAPDLTEALTDLDLQSLSFIKDRIALHIGNSTLDSITQNKAVILSTIMTSLSVVTKVAIGLIPLI